MVVTRKSAILETQHAIYDLVHTNAHIVTTHGCDVYDYIPPKTSTPTEPYIVIDLGREIPWDTLGDGLGQKVSYTIHVWSSYLGKKDCAEIITHLKELLDTTCSGGTTLTITGYTHNLTLCELTSVSQHPDMKHYHGVIELVVYVTQT